MNYGWPERLLRDVLGTVVSYSNSVIDIYHHSFERQKKEMNLHIFTMSGNVALTLQIVFLLLNAVESSAVPL